jgi:hypothetical protein
MSKLNDDAATARGLAACVCRSRDSRSPQGEHILQPVDPPPFSQGKSKTSRMIEPDLGFLISRLVAATSASFFRKRTKGVWKTWIIPCFVERPLDHFPVPTL